MGPRSDARGTGQRRCGGRFLSTASHLQLLDLRRLPLEVRLLLRNDLVLALHHILRGGYEPALVLSRLGGRRAARRAGAAGAVAEAGAGGGRALRANLEHGALRHGRRALVEAPAVREALRVEVGDLAVALLELGLEFVDPGLEERGESG